MNIREQVTISGIPLIWSTNLDDSALQEFYSLYRHAIFAPPTGPLEISVIVRYVDFRDGTCLWMVFANRHTVLFRTRDEFELWQARRNELAELRQEQDAEQAAERQLLITEDGHHEAQTEAALHNGNYDTAAAHVFARAELHSKCADLWSMPLPWSLWRSDFPFIFTKFPNSKYGMEFLRHYDMRRQAWTNFAHWYATRRRAENQEYELQTGLISTRKLSNTFPMTVPSFRPLLCSGAVSATMPGLSKSAKRRSQKACATAPSQASKAVCAASKRRREPQKILHLLLHLSPDFRTRHARNSLWHLCPWPKHTQFDRERTKLFRRTYP